MAYETIPYETDGATATLTLNRPRRLNTIVPQMADDLDAAVREANRDPAVKVLVLRGAGRAFCAGFDFGQDFSSGLLLSQLAAMKLIVNQAYESMGLVSTQLLGPLLDGYMRNTPEALRFVEVAAHDGVAAAIAERDGPFHDYSQAPPESQPDPRNTIGPSSSTRSARRKTRSPKKR